MPRDSQGSVSILPGTIVSTGDTVLPSQHNPAMTDLYAMMEQSLSRDGQGGMRAPLDMHGFPVVNVGQSSDPSSAATSSQLQSAMPLGTIVDTALPNAPDGWMLSFGQALSVSAYPDYTAAAYVGNALNATAGFGYRTTSQADPTNNRSPTGQFIVLPDFRGRIGVGRDDMGGSDSQRMSFFGAVVKLLGGVFGAASHKLNIDEMPIHDHGGETGESGEHNHTVEIRGFSDSDHANNVTRGANNTNRSGTYTTSTAPNHKHSIPQQGSGDAHPNAQPSIVINKIIKVSY